LKQLLELLTMKPANFQILILRLIIGTLFLFEGYAKYNEGWLNSAAPLEQRLASMQHSSGPQQYYYLTHVAVPYAGVWSRAMLLGEAALGISLVLGCCVRLSTLGGMFMLLNFNAATGTLFSTAFFSNAWAALLFAGILVLFLARAGRWAGIDQLLAKSNPKGILW
jgi:thiosulfate dehydrogenase (quinone) large subunit